MYLLCLKVKRLDDMEEELDKTLAEKETLGLTLLTKDEEAVNMNEKVRLSFTYSKSKELIITVTRLNRHCI